MNSTPMTTTEIVVETLRYYSENDFGISEDGSCKYLSFTGARCAVGRCLQTRRFDHKDTGVDELVFEYNMGQEDFLPQYRGHTWGFWADLQSLHDNWASIRAWNYNKNIVLSLARQALQRLQKVHSVRLTFQDLMIAPDLTYNIQRHD